MANNRFSGEELESNGVPEETDGNENIDTDFEFKQRSKRRKEETATIEFPKKKFDNPEYVSMMDRTKTSPNTVVAALLESGKVVGRDVKSKVDLDKFSFSSFWREKRSMTFFCISLNMMSCTGMAS